MGRCFSAHVAVESLNPAMHRRLGRPLPHLLPNTIVAVPRKGVRSITLLTCTLNLHLKKELA